MKYNQALHHRRSIRLREYDYAQAGAYFVTICIQNRECLFGEITAGHMRLNAAGEMMQQIWQELPEHYGGIDIDAFVVMPNHVHGIVVLVGQMVGQANKYDDRGNLIEEQGQAQGIKKGQAQGSAPTDSLSLPDVMHRYKTMTTKRYADGVKHSGWQPFPGKLWQRNYWERIIRDEQELQGIREYIQNNPARWEEDLLNAPNIVNEFFDRRGNPLWLPR